VPKKILREQMRAKIAAHPAAEAAEKSRRIEEKLFALPVFRRTRLVAFFASIAGEVDTHPMIDRALRDGMRVALPRVDAAKNELRFFEIKDRQRDTASGTLGILEPKPSLAAVDPASLECVIVPGLAFDKTGARLGRGAGYYDKFLARLSPRTAKIGVGFAFQLVKSVPTEQHDERLDLVLTD
jgi:5-formyltetrahydrofolate cyclo-ligase